MCTYIGNVEMNLLRDTKMAGVEGELLFGIILEGRSGVGRASHALLTHLTRSIFISLNRDHLID